MLVFVIECEDLGDLEGYFFMEENVGRVEARPDAMPKASESP